MVFFVFLNFSVVFVPGACVLSQFNPVWLFATLWIVAGQTPLSTGFSRQEYWSGFPCSSPTQTWAQCIGRESIPGLPCGRWEFYHWTPNAPPENSYKVVPSQGGQLIKKKICVFVGLSYTSRGQHGRGDCKWKVWPCPDHSSEEGTGLVSREEFESMALLYTPCSLLVEELGGVYLERKTQYTMMISFSLVWREAVPSQLFVFPVLAGSQGMMLGRGMQCLHDQMVEGGFRGVPSALAGFPAGWGRGTE